MAGLFGRKVFVSGGLYRYRNNDGPDTHESYCKDAAYVPYPIPIYRYYGLRHTKNCVQVL